MKPGINSSFNLNIAITGTTRDFRLRIRYAATVGNYVDITSSTTTVRVYLPQTTSPQFPETIPYEAFDIVDIPITFHSASGVGYDVFGFTFRFDIPPLILLSLFIDRIECVRVEGSLFEYETKQQLEKARKAVNHLFTDGSKKVLKDDTTDYEIDQAANLVECVSDECGHDKMILLDEVKYAKQLSEARDLLLNGNFDDLYTDRENPWKTSPNVTINEDNPIFKGRYLNMSGANYIEATNDTFPTYAYQKIDEAKLKPYTRYKVRGFVGSSKDLELLVTRYNEEVDAILNVPDNIPHAPTPDCGEFDRCKPYSYPPAYPLPECNPDFINQMEPSSCHYNKMVDNTNTNTDISSYPNGLGKKHRKCHQSHQFEFHIDTGKIDLVENLGMWVIFKICATDGYATLDNLEVIEEGPLGVEALERVKRREKKWRHQMEHKCSETKRKYDAAKQAVVALFTNSRYEKLKFETTLSNMLFADYLVQSIPYVYNKYLPAIPGMNYDIYTELNSLVQSAFYLYDRRNIIKNGRFKNGLMHWDATPHARVEQEDDIPVLVLPNWDANVSQDLCIEHNRGYVLRVTAKKEDPGAGNVTFSDCANHVDKLTFTSCDIGANHMGTNEVRNTRSNDPTDGVPYGQSGYGTNVVPNAQSNGEPYGQQGCEIDRVQYGQSGYGTDGRSSYGEDGVPHAQSGYQADGVLHGKMGYGTDGVTNDQSGYGTRKYHGCHTDGLPHQEHGCYPYPDRSRDGQQYDYVTKSIDIFPDTDKVRIDIGETEGTFKVEGVELICMEE